MDNKNRLASGIILLVLGLGLDLHWESQHLPLLFYMLNLLPGSILIAGWLYASLFSSPSHTLITIRSIVAFLGVILVSLMNVGTGFVLSITQPVTDITQYETVLKQEAGSRTAHFPSHVPENVTDVTLYYFPGFVQAPMTFQLCYVTSASEAESTLQRSISIEKHPQLPPGSGLPTTTHLSRDFQTIVLDAHVRADCNHGDSSGIAVAQEQHKICYWAEAW